MFFLLSLAEEKLKIFALSTEMDLVIRAANPELKPAETKVDMDLITRHHQHTTKPTINRSIYSVYPINSIYSLGVCLEFPSTENQRGAPSGLLDRPPRDRHHFFPSLYLFLSLSSPSLSSSLSSRLLSYFILSLSLRFQHRALFPRVLPSFT